ncbi:hypothetical protein [Mycobacterium sp.]|uniref:hypothetical protein n=1 Tax=Mycobacterium sp. TaxID=1785 RepID=UPI003BB220F7
MQLALRPYATVGVAILGAGLIYVTPVSAPHIEQHAVGLAAVEDSIDLVNPVDAGFSALTGAGGSALASVTDALPGAADLELLDPAFWEMFWNALIDPSGESASLLLTGALEQLPVIGPALESFGLFVVFPVSLLLAYAWSEIAPLLGLGTGAAAAEPLGTGLQGVYDAALSGVIDPAVPAGVSTALADVTPLFSDAAGALDPTTVVQDLSTALDPSVVTSVLDLNPIADLGTVLDPGGLADIGTMLSTSTIPDLGEIFTSLIP